MKSITRSSAIFCFVVIFHSAIGYAQFDSSIFTSRKSTFHLSAHEFLPLGAEKELKASLDWNSLKSANRFGMNYYNLLNKKPHHRPLARNGFMFRESYGVSSLSPQYPPYGNYRSGQPSKWASFAAGMGTLAGGILSDYVKYK